MAKTILEQWRETAYSNTANKGDLQRLWADYFEKEKGIYEQILKTPDEEVKGSVKELAEKFDARKKEKDRAEEKGSVLKELESGKKEAHDISKDKDKKPVKKEEASL